MMKSEKSRPALGMPKADFMKASSFNFLENERVHNVVQRGGVHDYQADECDSTILSQKLNGTNLKTKHVNNEVVTKSSSDAYNQVYMTKEEKKETSGSHPPKRYVTKCYFQPKQDPVSYSETVIVKIGSNKKQYFETVMYQTKLVPFRWTETMTTRTSFVEDNHQAHHEAFVEEPKFHYISLEPQQVKA